MTQSALQKAYPEEVKELWALIEKTDKTKPKAADRKALRTFLDTHPELWAYIGDIQEQATLTLIETQEKTTPAVLIESLKVGYRQMALDLARPGDGALEQIIMQQVFLCWLRLGFLEYQYTAVNGRRHSFAEMEHLERRMNAAQRRFTRAVETLSRVRKMALPALQVNIASQQVNQVNQKDGRAG